MNLPSALESVLYATYTIPKQARSFEHCFTYIKPNKLFCCIFLCHVGKFSCVSVINITLSAWPKEQNSVPSKACWIKFKPLSSRVVMVHRTEVSTSGISYCFKMIVFCLVNTSFVFCRVLSLFVLPLPPSQLSNVDSSVVRIKKPKFHSHSVAQIERNPRSIHSLTTLMRLAFEFLTLWT